MDREFSKEDFNEKMDFGDKNILKLSTYLSVQNPNATTLNDREKMWNSRWFDRPRSINLLMLTLDSVAGRPKPRVIWYLENSVIDDSYEHRPDEMTINHLSFPNVGRQHLNARLICQASNTQLAPPATKVVILDINLKPVAVNILNKERHISADKRYDVECRATGSRPAAVITWWKGSRQIKRLAKN
ncbi:unnamed protein product, partial [Nesidiocoris tenuis]